MGNLAVQKIIYLTGTDEILTWFDEGPTFRKKSEVPFLPDDLLRSGTWRNRYIIGLSKAYRQLVPAVVFIKDEHVLVKRTEEGNARIWFGDPIEQDTFCRYKTIEALAMQTIKKKRIRTINGIDLIGYCTYKGSRIRNIFLITYIAHVEKAPDKKTEQWVPVTNIYSTYVKFDPLSKIIFDKLYGDILFV